VESRHSPRMRGDTTCCQCTQSASSSGCGTEDPDGDSGVARRPGRAIRLRRRTVARTKAHTRLRRRGDPSAGDQMKSNRRPGRRRAYLGMKRSPAALTGDDGASRRTARDGLTVINSSGGGF
jgi:hypothetical protein